MQRLFITEEREGWAITPYEPSKHHGYKFLYIKKHDSEVLLVGCQNIMQHVFLLGAYESKKGIIQRSDLHGAGEIGIDGKIIGWNSYGLLVSTPFDLRDRITELVEE